MCVCVCVCVCGMVWYVCPGFDRHQYQWRRQGGVGTGLWVAAGSESGPGAAVQWEHPKKETLVSACHPTKSREKKNKKPSSTERNKQANKQAGKPVILIAVCNLSIVFCKMS